MRTIHKYVLTEAVSEVQTFEGVRFVAVDNQGERVTVWAEVDTDAPESTRTLHIIGTGGHVPPGLHHIGMAQVAGGAFVWHVYLEGRP